MRPAPRRSEPFGTAPALTALSTAGVRPHGTRPTAQPCPASGATSGRPGLGGTGTGHGLPSPLPHRRARRPSGGSGVGTVGAGWERRAGPGRAEPAASPPALTRRRPPSLTHSPAAWISLLAPAPRSRGNSPPALARTAARAAVTTGLSAQCRRGLRAVP